MSDLTGSPFQRNRPTTLDLRGNKITMVRNLATLKEVDGTDSDCKQTADFTFPV